MNLTADGQTVMESRYRHDAVDNILGITNAANPTSLTKLNKAKLGGRSSHTYEYDELNRLIHANGKAKRASYDMVMSFGRMSEPLTKVQKVDSTTTAKSYNFAYKYEDSNHPTAPTQIGHDHYTYDANGNPTLVTNDSANTTREMYWDEDNRLMVLSDNGKTSRYTYNAAGERIMKSYGTMEGVYINGAPQGITFHETDNFTLYPASILSVNKNRFTKHYFIGDKRIASRIGTGLFNNVYGRNGSYVTAGQQDYAERMNQIQTQKEAYYKKVGVAPGVPTEKGAYGDPENTGVGYNAVLTELGNHDVPQGWIQTPRPNTTPNTNPGPPVSWNDPSNPDDPQAGYGYIPNDTTKEETFFYHSDHLGSTSYITDDKANITQYDAYLPYGELLVDEHSSSEDLPYKFNGKQFDDETGLYYYGARYMNPITSLWYGVDPLAEKYTTTGGYVYTFDNPIKLIDPDGRGPGWNRFTGGLRVIGGSLQIIAGITGGIATSWSGVGAVVGGIAVVHGVDDVQAGVRQLWTGKEVDSFTFQGIKAGVKFAGASDNTANSIATFSDIGLGLVGGGAGLFKVLNKGTKVAEFTVAESKFDYFFGRVVEGNVHNVQRSAQNLKELTALGISSKKQLAKIFATTLVKGTEVSRSTNKYGITINKVLNIGKKGQIQTSFFYAGGDMTKAPKVTTIIPKIFKKK